MLKITSLPALWFPTGVPQGWDSSQLSAWPGPSGIFHPLDMGSFCWEAESRGCQRGTAHRVSPPKPPETKRAGLVHLFMAANFQLWALWVRKAIWGSSHLLRDTGEVAFPISVASSPRLPADTSVPSSFQREISISPEEAPVTFWPTLNCAQAPGEVAGGLWAPYNSEGLAAGGPWILWAHPSAGRL